MRIGIDGRFLLEKNLTGVGEYALGMIEQLADFFPQDELVVFLNSFHSINDLYFYFEINPKKFRKNLHSKKKKSILPSENETLYFFLRKVGSRLYCLTKKIKMQVFCLCKKILTPRSTERVRIRTL
jgi:hypothetical protein